MGSNTANRWNVPASDRWPADWHKSEYFRDEVWGMIGGCVREGLTDTEAAWRVGVSSKAVERYRKRMMGKPEPVKREPPPETTDPPPLKATHKQTEEWVKMHESGMNFTQIAQQTSFHRRTIGRNIKKYKENLNNER